MAEDARALAAMAASVREWGSDRMLAPAQAAAAVEGAILVHAMTLDADAFKGPPVSGAPPPTILVLLEDGPAIPTFLTEDASLDDAPADRVRRAIDARLREGLRRPPDGVHALDLLESVQDAIIAIDRERLVLYLNASAVALAQSLTSRTGPFVGRPLALAFPPAAGATLRPAIQAALVHATPDRVEEPGRHRGRALDVAVFPNPGGATLLIRDITKRKDTEAQLIDARVDLARAGALLHARDDPGPV